MKYLVILWGLLMMFTSCRNLEKNGTAPRNSAESQDLAQYVNPFVGTKNMGHTFPGAAVPFGMVQLSPQTNRLKMFDESGKYNLEAYRYCSGYQYDDTLIYGFAHTHFSGTGHSDLGDVLLMPFTGSLTSGVSGSFYEPKGFWSAFSHDDETAVPGFYKVRLRNFDVLAELTASEHVGFHQYRFPEADSAHLFLDMTANIYDYDGKNVWTFLRLENDSTISGYRQTTGWARTRTVYFVMRFSLPVTDYGHTRETVVYKGFYRKFNELRNFPEMAGREIKAYFTFNPP
ncbi:MAG TPA: glycoside hydrolase family 92 protein, partial [Bacteroidales bacterium]|nr:glycoside hydrolase family 92 protein [Bacteroidales bacterium]